jgi:N-acetyl-gamma-glutamylphosphate reductase
MIRGMQATLYVDLLDANTEVQSVFAKTYKNEHFITVLDVGVPAPLTPDLQSAIILDKSISLLSIRGLSANWMTVG